MRGELEAESAGPIAFERHGGHAFRGPAGADAFDVGLEGIDAGVGGRRGIVPVEKTAEVGVAEALAPAVDQPTGMGPGDGGIGVAEGGEFGADTVAIAVAAPEHGIEEAALRDETGLAGEFDRFVDGGVGRDAVEKEQLVDAEAEKVLERGLLGASVGAPGDDPVEGGALAEDAVDEFLGEAAIGGLEAAEIGIGLEAMLEEITGDVGVPDGTIGNLSWSGFLHAAILTVNQETASPQFSPGGRGTGKHRGTAVDGRAVAAVLPRCPVFWFWSRP